jgi:hypothetical protein
MIAIQYCFICCLSDSTVSEDAGIVPRTVATTALAVRRSNHSARSHPPCALVESDENMRECILLSSLTLRSSSVAVKKSSLSSRGCSDTLEER